jgi:lysophospholipase L1-like esterase
MMRLLANILLLAASLLVAVGLGEIAVRVAAPQKLSGSWFVIGPLGSYMNRAGGGSRQEMPDRTVSYEFNSYHQRGRAEPSASALKVLALGDSFTFGIGLELGETYVQQLQDRFDGAFGRGKVQLLNAGVGGTGTADQLAYVEAYGESLGVAAVVVFVSFGDFGRSLDRAIFEVPSGSQELVAVDRSSERGRLKRLLEGNDVYNFLLTHSHLVQLLRNAVAFGPAGRINTTTGAPDAATLAKERELARLLFRRLAAWCGARNVQLTVLTTGWPMVDHPWLADTLREEGIFFADLAERVAPEVLRDPAAYEIAGDEHPNPRGAALIADAAWPVLERRIGELLRR